MDSSSSTTPHFPPSTSRSPTKSIFTITPQEASQAVAQYNIAKKQMLVADVNNNMEESAATGCYLIYITVKPVYSDTAIPQSCYKKLPRLINGIPLGAGKLTATQSQNIQWRFIEGTNSFLSRPMTRDEAEESRKCLRDHLIRHGRQVFGDITVKLNIILTECIKYDEEIFINDIAYSCDEGLHFTD